MAASDSAYGNPYGAFSDPLSMEAIMGMDDYSAKEKQLAQQQLMARELRAGGNTPSSGTHWTRQAATALKGVGGAIAQYKADEAAADISQRKQKFRDDMVAAAKAKAAQEQTARATSTPQQRMALPNPYVPGQEDFT